MKRQFLATIALLIIIELINVEYVENCKTNVIVSVHLEMLSRKNLNMFTFIFYLKYFPSLKASAIAIMKGLSNGGPVRGTITFQQEVGFQKLYFCIFLDFSRL